MPLYRSEYSSDEAQLKARFWGAVAGMGASEYCARLADGLPEPPMGIENVDWKEVDRIKRRRRRRLRREVEASEMEANG
ncbi:hypothetical protein IQ267_25430 [filamentous cyanobacterium LEGE 07170]|nr:hypothetical protein [filamentous cyanobacterium LEGE 07170]